VKPTATASKASTTGDASLLNKLKGIQGFSADMTIDDAGDKTEGKIAYSPTKMRMDIKNKDASLVMYADKEKNLAYIYNAAEKSALSMPYDPAQDMSENIEDLFDYEKNMTAPPKYLGDEKISGKTCAIYEFTFKEGTYKNWLDKETGFPLKSVSTINKQTATVVFSNVKIGNPDVKTLTLPADTQILDMSSLMTGTPVSGSTSIDVQVSGSTSLGSGSSTSESTTSGSSTALSPTAISGPVPAHLKDNFKIPSGFTLISDSGQETIDGNTNIFVANGSWSGNATPEQITDFYQNLLSKGWSYGGMTDNTSAVFYFEQNNTNPVITLIVQAEIASSSNLVLGSKNYNKWLRATIKSKKPAGNIILTLTMTNGKPEE
jgi:hypothetical protein